jgi:tRNA (guanine-N7-)-methyltransferase
MRRPLRDYPAVSLKQEDLNGRIDFLDIFGRKGAVHIEVGCGKGTFLLNQARAEPDANFLGIEWAGKYYRYVVDRIGRWEIGNVRIIRTEAASFLADFVADGSVQCFHIYFPDPWPKKRHHKRRLFSQANMEQFLRCLVPGGIIKTVTDHADYFEQIKMVLKFYDGRIEEIDFDSAEGADTGEWVGTNFERKYLREQRKIYTMAVRKL